MNPPDPKGSEVKLCKGCGQSKPLTAYYLSKGQYRPRCKPCHNIKVKQGRNRFLRGISEAVHAQKRPKRSYDPKYRKRATENLMEWKRKNPHKVLAHRIVFKAIRNGVLIRPKKCEKCCVGGRIEASHSDYSKPLMVEWLCPKCHRIKDIGTWVHLIPRNA
jgi:hypothetical protein